LWWRDIFKWLFERRIEDIRDEFERKEEERVERVIKWRREDIAIQRAKFGCFI